jgi:hypothetical protein
VDYFGTELPFHTMVFVFPAVFLKSTIIHFIDILIGTVLSNNNKNTFFMRDIHFIDILIGTVLSNNNKNSFFMRDIHFIDILIGTVLSNNNKNAFFMRESKVQASFLGLV